jgi:DNA-binding HxlR family transcriptional regulator
LAAATSPRAAILRDTWSGLDASSVDEHTVRRIGETLDVLRGKWKVQLLFLMARGVHRHSGLLAGLSGASKKVMTDTLRSLESDGLVARRILAEAPARVEYSLTHLGWSIAEPLVALFEWGEAHAQEVTEARRHARFGADERSARRTCGQA